MTPILLVVNDKRQVTSFVKNLAKTHQVAPAYIFEIVPESKEISINQIREIKKQVAFSFSDSRIFVLYDFDTASYQAQNAFLKTLEEHAENIYFLLCVSSLYNMLPTVNSRCQVIDLRKGKETTLENELEKEFEEVVSSLKNLYLAKKAFQIKTASEGIKTCGHLLSFFRNRLEKDLHATMALREVLKTQALILHNNVNPQYAVDRLLIAIHHAYQKA